MWSVYLSAHYDLIMEHFGPNIHFYITEYGAHFKHSGLVVWLDE